VAQALKTGGAIALSQHGRRLGERVCRRAGWVAAIRFVQSDRKDTRAFRRCSWSAHTTSATATITRAAMQSAIRLEAHSTQRDDPGYYRHDIEEKLRDISPPGFMVTYDVPTPLAS
jgi:hypothetical protein